MRVHEGSAEHDQNRLGVGLRGDHLPDCLVTRVLPVRGARAPWACVKLVLCARQSPSSLP